MCYLLSAIFCSSKKIRLVKTPVDTHKMTKIPETMKDDDDNNNYKENLNESGGSGRGMYRLPHWEYRLSFYVIAPKTITI